MEKEMGYEIQFGKVFSFQEKNIELKGWFDVDIAIDGALVSISFYDPVRLKQEIEDSITQDGFFFERNVVVVSSVIRPFFFGAPIIFASSQSANIPAVISDTPKHLASTFRRHKNSWRVTKVLRCSDSP